MPTYATLADLPGSAAVQTWQALVAQLKAQPELAFLSNRVIRHDVPSLQPEISPLLCCVKLADDWEPRALGAQAGGGAPYKVTFDYGLRLYLYAPKGLETAALEALYDQIEDANAVLVQTLRSAAYASRPPYWKELHLVGGARGNRTSIIARQEERLSITTQIRLVRAFARGQ